jgi:hypothetical protein
VTYAGIPHQRMLIDLRPTGPGRPDERADDPAWRLSR